jgi:hypothetical protein
MLVVVERVPALSDNYGMVHITSTLSAGRAKEAIYELHLYCAHSCACTSVAGP